MSLNYQNIIANLSTLEQPQALNVWWILNSSNLDCIWNPETCIHEFVMRSKLKPEPTMHGSEGAKRLKLLELLEQPLPDL